MAIYLDNAATSFPKPMEVADAVYDFMVGIGVSSGRGAYRQAMKADSLVYETRKLLCSLFNGYTSSRVVFTLNVTDAINIALKGILKKGDHVIAGPFEHNAVIRPLMTMIRDIGIEVSFADCDKFGRIDINEVEKLIGPTTKLMIFNHASNVFGRIAPIDEIGRLCRDHGIIFMTDCAQTAGAIPIDMKGSCIDILAFTGHKALMGPFGTGGLVIAEEIDIQPVRQGGTGGDSAHPYQVDYYPNRLEAGTLNVSGIAGLHASLRWIDKTGIENIMKKEQSLRYYAWQKLEKIDGLDLYGDGDEKANTSVIAFNVQGISCERLAARLDKEYGIMIRAGLHCSPSAHRIMDTLDTGSVRISFGWFNEKEDIDKLAYAIEYIAKSV